MTIKSGQYFLSFLGAPMEPVLNLSFFLKIKKSKFVTQECVVLDMVPRMQLKLVLI